MTGHALTRKPIIIGIAGPSCSGKTTLCLALKERFPELLLVHADQFWHARERFPTINGMRNWELPECLDFPKLASVIEPLKRGESAEAEVMVWRPGAPGRVELTRFLPAPIIVVEGFLLFTDPHVRELCDVRVYLELDDETYLQRRLARQRSGKEGRERYYREVVVPAFREHGRPTKAHAHLVLDATKPIEENAQLLAGEIGKRLETSH